MVVLNVTWTKDHKEKKDRGKKVKGRLMKYTKKWREKREERRHKRVKIYICVQSNP